MKREKKNSNYYRTNWKLCSEITLFKSTKNINRSKYFILYQSTGQFFLVGNVYRTFKPKFIELKTDAFAQYNLERERPINKLAVLPIRIKDKNCVIKISWKKINYVDCTMV